MQILRVLNRQSYHPQVNRLLILIQIENQVIQKSIRRHLQKSPTTSVHTAWVYYCWSWIQWNENGRKVNVEYLVIRVGIILNMWKWNFFLLLFLFLRHSRLVLHGLCEGGRELDRVYVCAALRGHRERKGFSSQLHYITHYTLHTSSSLTVPTCPQLFFLSKPARNSIA